MTVERTTDSYGPGVTAASRSVLVELITVLRSYHDALVLVGGWAPYYLLHHHQRADDPFVHVGSIDIDLVVDPATIDGPRYRTVAELLAERGYQPAQDRRGKPLQDAFERIIPSPVNQKTYTIRVDFLSHPDEQATGRQRHRPVQDGLVARKLRGCDAALRYRRPVTVTGTLPAGGELSVSMQMADIVSCLTMKGIVLGERYREKDAYDIYALVAHYGQGPREVAQAIRPHLHDPLVREAMMNIRAAFAKRESHGTAWAAAFLVSPMFADDYARQLTDAFMTVQAFSDDLFAAGSVPAGEPETTKETLA